jgi:ABC-type Fe3+/spermidine/putrescine transport system ATPase subunit
VSERGSGTYVRLEGLVKRFGDLVAVDAVSLAVRQGDFLALLGPSGSGKTTTLRLLAGFELPDAGTIRVGGEDVTRLSPAARRFGMVFQHYALFPHLTVGENVAFGLESLGVSGEALGRRVAESLALVELAGFEDRRVSQLSGGQQQRVALARALAPEPRVLLLDEPLSNLDPSLRERTRRELKTLIQRVGITTILVTHEQEEAFDLGDRVAVLCEGRLEQVGPPEELYATPRTAFVAGFVGRASRVRVEVEGADQGRPVVRVAGARWVVTGVTLPAGPAQLLVRPEAVHLAEPAAGRPAGDVVARRYTGAAAFYHVRLGTGDVIEVEGDPHAARAGDRVALEPRHDGGGLHLFPEGV